jgi:dTDP-4-dehydrorhamnose reductase
MKIFVTGVGGQLGYEVVQELQRRSIDCIGTDIKEFDITAYEDVHRFITAYGPDAVIHCSAYTAVDKAESNKDVCRQVNADGPANIARVCREIGAKMVFISTDYVYPGTGTAFWDPDDRQHIAPLNWYGQTKWEGEEAVRNEVDHHFIVRISWAFGKHGNNFINTMLRLAATHDEINVVADQIGSPTYMADLAPLLCDMVMTERYGTYHATNEGICSWADFAEEIFRQAGVTCKVNPIPTSAYPTAAKRPFNSRMSKDKLLQNGFHTLPTWQDALRRYLEEIKQ